MKELCIKRLLLIAVVAMNPAVVFWEVTLCSLIEIYQCPLKTVILYQAA
jgi:hypothetical protein